MNNASRLRLLRRKTLYLATVPLLAPGFAAAQEQSQGLEEIIVTAQFRAQNVQQTPISISAFDAAMLDARSATDINDAANACAERNAEPWRGRVRPDVGHLHPWRRPGRSTFRRRARRRYVRRRRLLSAADGLDLRVARRGARRGAPRPTGHAGWQELDRRRHQAVLGASPARKTQQLRGIRRENVRRD